MGHITESIDGKKGDLNVEHKISLEADDGGSVSDKGIHANRDIARHFKEQGIRKEKENLYSQ